MQIIYTTPKGRITLEVADKQDWSKVADWCAKKLGLAIGPDLRFDAIYKRKMKGKK